MKQLKIFIILGVAVLISGCSWLYSSHQGGNNTDLVDLTEADLHVPEFEFVNQFGEPGSTEDLKGQLWISNMIFVRCPTVCTMMTPNMMLLQNKIIEEGLDVQLVSFTVDPEFDTPAQLENYGQAYNADFDHWTFVTGYSDEEITEFAETAFLSIVMDIEDSDDMIHATSFFLTNEEGQVIRKYDGLDIKENEIIQDLKRLLNQ